MRLPNKITPFKESALSKFPIILSKLKDSDMPVLQLFYAVKDDVDNIADYLEVLDCLYALKEIEINKETEVLHYVK